MPLTQKYQFLISYFTQQSPEASSELQYTNAYELLVAVILSAQCTDKRVNLVTPPLLERFPSPLELSLSSFEEVFSFIKSVSYPNNKTKHLIGMAQKLVSDFCCIVPQTLEDLQSLPGVGRKTANVILSVMFNQPAMAVDTHVFRVAHRLGLVKDAKTPLEVEKQLVKHLPENVVAKAHHWLILHGRYVCTARKPKCDECGLLEICFTGQKEKGAKEINN